MRRMALALAAIGVMALGMTGTAAQAHEVGRGYHARAEQAWRGHEWRAHHNWRVTAFERHRLPPAFFGFFHR